MLATLVANTSAKGLTSPSEAQSRLIAVLMGCLEHHRLDFRHLAYRTLCSLITVKQAIRDGNGLSTSCKRELLLIGDVCDISALETGPCKLSSLVNSGAWAASHHRQTSEWITTFAPFIARAAGDRDAFFARLQPILQADRTLAEEMLPALVQGILEINDESGGTRQTLSKYLQQVLASARTPTSTVRIVIDVILHLRAIQPPWSPSKLAADTWLDVDFMTLSRAALRCNAYATALKFLETARDVDSPAGLYAQRDVDCHEVSHASRRPSEH
jgi:ataxia telangiectasia mutated family protein